jgi:cathepsin A (carboxypeptidase C)
MYVESLDKPETDPIIIYFNGGPGGASTFLNFVLMGPYLSSDGSSNLTPWQYSWNRRANLMFIDNPAGVGYSYAERDIDIISSDYQYTRDAISFIK